MFKRKKQNDLSGGCLSLFGLPFLVAGIVLSAIYFNGYRKWIFAQSWVETPCWIETTELVATRGQKSTSYKTVATYRYDFEGQTYRGDSVSLYFGSDNIGSFQKDAYRELSKYSETVPAKRNRAKGLPATKRQTAPRPFRCYVNPREPSESVIYRTLRWPMQAFMAIFALTFPAVGAGLALGGALLRKHSRREHQLQLEYPGEPWKWKLMWSGSTIADKETSSNRAIYAYTIWSALVIGSLLLTTGVSGAFFTEKASWFLMVFLLLWCIPAWMSWKQVKRWLAIGGASLSLRKPVTAPGETLAGEVVFAKALPWNERPVISLQCIKRTSQATRNGSQISHDTVWQADLDEADLSRARATSDQSFPFSFEIPSDAVESCDGTKLEAQYRWEVVAKLPQGRGKAVFEVPVFHNESSRAFASASLSSPGFE